MKLIVALALACLVAVASAQINCQAIGVVVDDFTVFANAPNGFDRIEATQGVDTTLVNANPITGAAGSYLYVAETFPPPPGAPDHILGGYRDSIVYINQNSNPPPSAGQGVRININQGLDNNNVLRPQLRYSTDQGIYGIGEIQWDGNSDQSNPRNFVKTGLGGIDLTLGGASSAFTLSLVDTDLPLIIRVEAWSYAGGVAANSQGVYTNWNPSTTNSLDLFFTDFLPITGSVDPTSVFRSVGAMRMFITDAPGSPPEIDLVVYSLNIPNRYCLLKAVASGTASGLDARFNLFTGSTNSLIASDNCNNQFVNVGTRVTFLVQAFIENVAPSTFSVIDVVDPRLTLVPASVQVYTHGTSTANLTSSITSTANNRLQVTFTVLKQTTSYVSIFFEATVLASGVATDTCIVVIPNRASLNATGLSISSFNYNGQTAADRNTRFCVRASPDFVLTTATDVAVGTTVTPGHSFTLTTSYRNSGQITAGDVVINATLNCADLSFANTAGWTQSGNTYSRDLGSLAVSSALTTLTSVINVASSAKEETCSITICITNVGASLPGFCTHSYCSTVSVNIKPSGKPNVKICKRGYMVRQLEFELDYFNPCADGATDVVLTDRVPPGTVFNADQSDNRWNCDANGVCTIDVGTVAANGSGCGIFVVDILDTTPPCTVFHNNATVVASNDVDLTDNWDYARIVEPGCPNRQCYEECDAFYANY